MKSITQQINNFFLDNNNIFVPIYYFSIFHWRKPLKEKKGFNLPKTDLFSFKFFFIKYFFFKYLVCVSVILRYGCLLINNISDNCLDERLNTQPFSHSQFFFINHCHLREEIDRWIDGWMNEWLN